MSHEKISRNFVKELDFQKKDNTISNTTKPKCALDIQKNCCKGRGFKFTDEGCSPYAQAQICSCVLQCPTCCGKMQILNGGYIRDCQRPSPKRICNLINDAQIPSRYTHAYLSDFNNHSGNCNRMIEEIKKWEKSFSSPSAKGLLLSGPVGVGKTFILCAIAKRLAYKGLKIKFIDFFQLITQIKASYSEHQSEQKLISPLIHVDVLIIDELGKGRNTDFELTILDQLIMGRYNQNKAIIASTNCHITDQTKRSNYEDIALDQEGDSKQGKFAPDHFGTLESRVGSRIFSRLVETSCVMELTGDDYRKKREKTWLVF